MPLAGQAFHLSSGQESPHMDRFFRFWLSVLLLALTFCESRE